MKSFDRRHIIALADDVNNVDTFIKTLFVLNVKSHNEWTPIDVNIRGQTIVAHRKIRCYDDIDEVIDVYKKFISTRQLSGKGYHHSPIAKSRLELLYKIKHSDLKLPSYVDKPVKRPVQIDQKKSRISRVQNKQARIKLFLTKWNQYIRTNNDA